jgi:hypothetical protein
MSRVTVRRWMRRLSKVALGVFSVYALFLVAMFIVMCQPPERFGKIMSHVPMPTMMVVPFEPMWNVARGGATRVGEWAPDFELSTVDRKSVVRLSEFRGKQPVVLVFGSYT